MASVEELSRKYTSQLSQLHAIFPTWDEGDLAFTLQDTKGNVEDAVLAITEGRASQFTQATRKKPTKATPAQHGKGYSNRNADSGGWENANGGGDFGGRGGRGGSRGARGGRGGRGGEPVRGGRGGRGGIRGGRGGFAGAATANGGPKANGFPTSTDTTTDGWASQVEQSDAAEAAVQEGAQSTTVDADTTVKAEVSKGAWGKPLAAPAPPPAEASKADDFSAAGGLSDAPAPKELEKAAKAGGTEWEEEIKKPVPTAPAAKPKLTWAQIAKPIEKPKPAPPPPAPKAEPAPPVTTEEPTSEETQEQVPEEVLEETPAETSQAWGDAPAAEEVEQQAEAIVEAQPEEETYADAQADEVLPEEPPTEQTQEEAWGEDPAIAGSGIGAQPTFAQTQTQAPASQVPEPVTTYTGPPGFNTIAAKAAAASQPRTASRAGRYKNADDQGVVLPAAASGVSAMEMQFGSLSFGGQAGDGVEAPVPEPQPETPAQSAPAPAAPAVTSPIRAPQPPSAQPAPAAVAPPTAPATTISQPPSSVHPYYSQQQQAAQPPAQPQQQQQQPSGYNAPQQSLQQQASSYGSQFLHHQQQQPQAPAQDQYQQSGFYRGQPDYSSAFGSQAQQSVQQQQQQQQQQPTQSQQHEQQQAPSSQQPQHDPYQSYGGFGNSHLFGQQQQQQQQQHNQHQQVSDAFGGAHRGYDSYAASGYPRASAEDSKQTTAAPSQPSAPAQPQHQQQSPYYSHTGYQNIVPYGYNAAPYNPYYQYTAHAQPAPGFHQYVPQASRPLYGQSNPQAPSAPVPQATKPSPVPGHSPYGGPSPYPSSSYDEQPSLGAGRYGESKTPSQQNQGPQSYQSGSAGLHGFLGASTNSVAARPQAATPDDGFKSQTAQSQVGTQGQQARATPQQGLGAASGQQQQQHAGFGYPYGGNAGYGGQDWSQYNQQQQHYGSRNVYGNWP